jgi:hypothetical protein
MSLLFIITGVLAAMVGAGGYLFRVVRDVEDILPDHQAAAAPPPEEVETAPAPEPA